MFIKSSNQLFVIAFCVFSLVSCNSGTIAPVVELHPQYSMNKSQTTYVVRPGDTLYAIAFLYDQNYEQLAQTNPFQPSPSVPMATQPPATQQLVQQIQAPVNNMPTTPVPVPQAPAATQQLIKQIAAPTTPRTPAPMNQATQQFAQQFRPQPAPAPAPRPQMQPVARPQPMAQPRRFQAQIRQPARSVSRVNPPLLPSRPTGRR